MTLLLLKVPYYHHPTLSSDWMPFFSDIIKMIYSKNTELWRLKGMTFKRGYANAIFLESEYKPSVLQSTKYNCLRSI